VNDENDYLLPGQRALWLDVQLRAVPYRTGRQGLAHQRAQLPGRKSPDSDYAEATRQQRSPMIAARMGRSRKQPLRADWKDVKESVMRAAVPAKFTQHADLRALLLQTGDALLVEHTTNDNYWADGGDEIYVQLYPFWDGEDEVFAIRSAEDAGLLPNLKSVKLLYVYPGDERILEEFRQRGIAAQWL